MTDKTYDVAIVGGGPVGMALAIELGQRGIRPVVIERYEEPQPIPKGQNLTQRTMEHFHFWGAEKELRAARPAPKEYGIGGMTNYRTLLSEYHYDWLQRELVRPYYFTDNERLPQYATEAVLRARAAEIPEIDIRYGWSGEDLVQDEDGVTVTVRRRNGEETDTVRAAYVVGCDGSRSVVREKAGIRENRSEHDKLMVLLVFRSEELHELLKRYPGKAFYNVLHPDLDGYWLFFGRVDFGTTWFFHAPVPAGTTRDNFDFKAYVKRAVGTDFDLDLQHIGFWDLRVAVAKNYRNGRVFIAGDAAHSHPPYGGFGINTGFEDARNLGWKLAATFEGWAGERLLDSYDEERRPVFASTARDFIENFIEEDRKFLRAYSPEKARDEFERVWSSRNEGSAEVHAFEPNYEGSSIVFGAGDATPSARGQHSFIARPGHHLSPQRLSSGSSVFDALGPDFTLIALDADPGDVSAFEEAAWCKGIPLKVVQDTYSGDRTKLEARLILVRPDNFVAWAEDRLDGNAEEILTCAAGY